MAVTQYKNDSQQEQFYSCVNKRQLQVLLNLDLISQDIVNQRLRLNEGYILHDKDGIHRKQNYDLKLQCRQLQHKLHQILNIPGCQVFMKYINYCYQVSQEQFQAKTYYLAESVTQLLDVVMLTNIIHKFIKQSLKQIRPQRIRIDFKIIISLEETALKRDHFVMR